MRSNEGDMYAALINEVSDSIVYAREHGLPEKGYLKKLDGIPDKVGLIATATKLAMKARDGGMPQKMYEKYYPVANYIDPIAAGLIWQAEIGPATELKRQEAAVHAYEPANLREYESELPRNPGK